MQLTSFFNSLLIDNNDLEIYSLLKNKSLFITGGTGFFGKWLLLMISRANDLFQTNIKIQILSRDPDQFLEANSFFKTRSELSFIKGDILNFDFQKVEVDYLIHAATEASVKLNKENPTLMYETCVMGAKRIIELAQTKKEIKKILFTSSGAVYGEIPSQLCHVSESYIPQKLPTREENAYMLGKIESERLFLQNLNNIVVARCFAFVGPFLPLDAHFAIGNFMGDVLAKREIIIQGDGTALRSYLYASDLVTWLLTMLTKGKNKTAYNLGSEESVSIRELADIFIELYPETRYKILKKIQANAPINCYVPSTEKARSDLGLVLKVPLREAIRRTMDYHFFNSKN